MQLTPGQAFAQSIAYLDPPLPWAIAVSGGPDSTALMHLAAAHCRMHGHPTPWVFTVDHGLRTTSAAEAVTVAEAARSLGHAHRTLHWTGAKPDHGIQQAARKARYGLMGEACAHAGMASLLTGHTRDDQIETIQMRAARGSGSLGLAGMPAQADLPGFPVRLVRPLLALPKSDLLTWLDGQSISCVTDPSNADPRFDRARLRQHPMSELPAPDHILAAQQARMRLEVSVLGQLSRWFADRKDMLLVPESLLADASDEVADLALAAILRAAGGAAYPGTRAERARLLASIRNSTGFRGRTLAGTLVRRARRAEASPADSMLVFRPENREKTVDTRLWLPFAQHPQIGFDGGRLTISTIFTDR